MRAGHLTARTVVLRLRFADFSRATRSRSLAFGTASSDELRDAALGLLDAARDLVAARGITLVGVALTGLASDTVVQPPLPLSPPHDELDRTVDSLADRFGSRAVQRASLLVVGDGFEAPQLDDVTRPTRGPAQVPARGRR
nr:hypothetical protein [Cellulomonas uda]